MDERKLRAVIVDDEELARAYLHELLDAHPEIEIAAECANGFEAVKAIADSTPDLLFLDVQMPKLDGFEVLELIDPGPAIVFVTAYDQYAIRAFDAHAADYLLKPFGADRFERALERAKARLGQRQAPAELAAVRPPEQRPERLVVKDGTRVHVLNSAVPFARPLVRQRFSSGPSSSMRPLLRRCPTRSAASSLAATSCQFPPQLRSVPSTGCVCSMPTSP